MYCCIINNYFGNPNENTFIENAKEIYEQAEKLNINNRLNDKNYITINSLNESVLNVKKNFTYAFLNKNLINVILPKSLEKIGNLAFASNKLKTVKIEGKSSSKEFNVYESNWGWYFEPDCVIDNTENIKNGCIIWNK